MCALLSDGGCSPLRLWSESDTYNYGATKVRPVNTLPAWQGMVKNVTHRGFCQVSDSTPADVTSVTPTVVRRCVRAGYCNRSHGTCRCMCFLHGVQRDVSGTWAW
jgi:hypothetical protein